MYLAYYIQTYIISSIYISNIYAHIDVRSCLELLQLKSSKNKICIRRDYYDNQFSNFPLLQFT